MKINGSEKKFDQYFSEYLCPNKFLYIYKFIYFLKANY